MVFSIRHVEDITVECHALWVIETGRGKIAIGPANVATASDIENLPGHVSNDDTIVIGIRDEEPVGSFVRLDFAGKR